MGIISAAVSVVVGTAVTAGVIAVQFNDRPTVSAPFSDAAVGAPAQASTSGYPLGITPTDGALPESGGVSIAEAAASCVSAPGVDSAGNPFTYEGRNAVDGQLDSAWRCDHDGVGEGVLLTLSRPATVRWIGVVPGFAKTDPYDGTDRYLQCRRVSSARFVFDDGTYVEHWFDVTTTSRSMQVVTFPPHVTTQIRMIILASVPGSPTNGQGPTDKVAVSEVAVGE